MELYVLDHAAVVMLFSVKLLTDNSIIAIGKPILMMKIESL